jgi:hypothetical protein
MVEDFGLDDRSVPRFHRYSHLSSPSPKRRTFPRVFFVPITTLSRTAIPYYFGYFIHIDLLSLVNSEGLCNLVERLAKVPVSRVPIGQMTS